MLLRKICIMSFLLAHTVILKRGIASCLPESKPIEFGFKILK